jgi:O-antigen/teichoic acid export membrane protein
LFAPDLVEYVLGDKWQPAVVLLQAFGAIAAFNHVGFNWEAFYRARGDTKPVAVVAGIATVVYLAVTMPLLATEGLDGFAIGMAIQTAVVLAVRTFFLTRLFAGFQLVRHMARAVAPSIPAALLVLLVRQLENGPRTDAMAIGEFVLYVLATIAATAFFERALLREIMGYLRSGRAQPAPA